MSAWLAPVFLIAGFLLGAWAQPDSYHWLWEDISSLASIDAPQRWWMNGGFVGNGLCHLITGYKMRRSYGRALLMLGGVGVLIVAWFPEPPHNGQSLVHNMGAGLAFSCFASWPLFAIDERVWATQRRVAFAASGVMRALLGGFLLTLFGVPAVGLVERALAVAEAVWPLVVFESVRRDRIRSGA